MAGFQLGGLASGLDTDTIISQLMSIERQPRLRLERKQTAVQARQDVLRDISAKLKALKLAAADLRSVPLWTPQQTLSSSDPARVAVRATGVVTTGSYDITVQQLASRTQRTFVFATHPAPSQITITDSGGTARTVNVAGNATIDDVAAAVNADSALPVTARVVNGQLTMESRVSGAGNGFTATGKVLSSQASSVAGADAQFTVNGVAQTSSTNVSTTAIAGVELTLSGLTSTPVRVSTTAPTVDRDAVAQKVKAFVDSYNAVVDLVRGKLNEKRVPNAETVTDVRKGVLFADGGLSNVLRTLRNGMMDPVAGNATGLDELAELGVSTGPASSTIVNESVAGRLVFDEAKFKRAWDADPAAVERLLKGTATQQGFAGRMESLVGPMTDVGGLFDGRITSTTSELSRLKDQLARMDSRLVRKEQYLRRQFTQLETALQRAQSQQTDLNARLAGLVANDD